MTETATYLYCLVRDPERPPAEDLPAAPLGVPAASPPRLLPVADDLWLVAADAPLPAYGEAEIAAHLEDLAWVSDRALAHEAVVEHFADPSDAAGAPASSRAIVPMKLFTLFASDERAVAHVAGELPRVRQALDRVAGREEWGVRLRLDRTTALRAAVPRAAEAVAVQAGQEDDSPASGRDFLARKKRLRDAAKKRPAEAREAAEGAYAALAGRAAEAVERPIEAAGSLILDAAFLVPRAERGAFEEAVAEQARELAGAHLELTLTGPWPPYHFVGEGP
ncbi:MAG TPA: GvpL/GvpF family gas vesicle protein [Thermoanaerobaculia bacterium]|nr:GvpL/GvpF family gas vesicle protein [Thermoanaerobaculia bacterium]